MKTTHDELLALVGQRYPNLDAHAQGVLAHAAVKIMAEPQWEKIPLSPMRAVKLASHRSKHRQSF